MCTRLQHRCARIKLAKYAVNVSVIHVYEFTAIRNEVLASRASLSCGRGACSLTDFPAEAFFKTCTAFDLTDDEWLLTNEYFCLLWHEVNSKPLSVVAITHIQTAMLARLHVIHQTKSADKQYYLSRQHSIFHRFIALLSEHGIQERNISFYANCLCVTPNHLGFVIKQISGLTVIQWVNRHIIQQAKVQLKYSYLLVWEIAENLNFPNSSFFSSFFKKETGVSPGEYRNKK